MRRFIQFAIRAFSGLVLTACATVASQNADEQFCNEKCLLQIAGLYMDAIPANYPEDVPLSAKLRATENGVDTKIGEGIWSSVTGWTYRHTVVDPVSGGIGIFGVVMKDDGKNAILAIRLQEQNQEIVESEIIVVLEDDFPVFKTDATRAREAFYTIVPEEYRNTRDELEEIARGYFTGLATGDPSKLSFHPDCNRLENGFQTTNNPPLIKFSCRDLYPFTYMQSYRSPDFPVIDTKRGLVLGFTAFDLPEAERTVDIRGEAFEINNKRQRLPRTLFLCELFKVENGQILMIDAVVMDMPAGQKMGWGER